MLGTKAFNKKKGLGYVGNTKKDETNKLDHTSSKEKSDHASLFSIGHYCNRKGHNIQQCSFKNGKTP